MTFHPELSHQEMLSWWLERACIWVDFGRSRGNLHLGLVGIHALGLWGASERASNCQAFCKTMSSSPSLLQQQQVQLPCARSNPNFLHRKSTRSSSTTGWGTRGRSTKRRSLLLRVCARRIEAVPVLRDHGHCKLFLNCCSSLCLLCFVCLKILSWLGFRVQGSGF